MEASDNVKLFTCQHPELQCTSYHGAKFSVFLTRVKQVKEFLPVLGVPGEEGLSVVPLGFAEVVGSDLVSRANL